MQKGSYALCLSYLILSYLGVFFFPCVNIEVYCNSAMEMSFSQHLHVAQLLRAHFLFCPDCKRHGEHMAGAARHEVAVHADVLLQELPQHRQDQQLHQLPELFPPEGSGAPQASRRGGRPAHVS